MQLIKWEPLEDLDRFFDDRFMLFPKVIKLGWDLAVDIYKENGNIIAKMSLPGIKPEELEVSFEDDVLTVSGHREEEEEIDRKAYYSKEIRRGSFIRSFSLPKMADPSKAHAKYVDGFLIVSIPAVNGVEGKPIKIKVEK